MNLSDFCDGGFEELGDVEDGRDDDDGDDIVDDSPPGVGALDRVVVLDGLRDSQVPLQGQDHGHKDGRQNSNALQLIPKIKQTKEVMTSQRWTTNIDAPRTNKNKIYFRCYFRF